MPDTPIDLSEGIQSVRLKMPTAEVPIPPAGFSQLHSPAPGELALRLPDGSVVPVGGGGGPPETPFMLLGSGGTVDTSADLHGVGVTVAAGVGKTIRLAAPLVGAAFEPLGVQVATVPISTGELQALDTTDKVVLAAPGAGAVAVPLLWVIEVLPDSDGDMLPPFGATVLLRYGSGTGPQVGTGVFVGGNSVTTPTSPEVSIAALANGLANVPRADVDNQPLVLRSDSPIPVTDATALVTLWYVVR